MVEQNGFIKYRGMVLECHMSETTTTLTSYTLKAKITGTLKIQLLPPHLNYTVLFLVIAHLNVQHCTAMWSRLTNLISWRLEKVWARMCYHWHKFGYRCAVFPTRSVGRVGRADMPGMAAGMGTAPNAARHVCPISNLIPWYTGQNPQLCDTGHI